MISLKAINAALRLFGLKLIVTYCGSNVHYAPIYFKIEQVKKNDAQNA